MIGTDKSPDQQRDGDVSWRFFPCYFMDRQDATAEDCYYFFFFFTFLTFIFRESELVVTVQGPRPDNILFLVHEVFEGLIAESFHGVQYDFQLPCPECCRMVS